MAKKEICLEAVIASIHNIQVKTTDMIRAEAIKEAIRQLAFVLQYRMKYQLKIICAKNERISIFIDERHQHRMRILVYTKSTENLYHTLMMLTEFISRLYPYDKIKDEKVLTHSYAATVTKQKHAEKNITWQQIK